MTEIRCEGPYDLALSARVAAGFAKRTTLETESAGEASLSPVRLGVWLGERPMVLEIHQTSLDPPVLEVVTRPATAGVPAEWGAARLAARVTNAAMPLTPFYRLVEAHPVLGPVTRRLRGVKPFRPSSLFDMMVMAVTEQQISLVAAQRIQAKLVGRFGVEIEGLSVFPRAETLATASIEDLVGCGLSRRKAEYIGGAAAAVAGGALDLDALAGASDDEVRARISALRGFGLWSADYLLVRGLGRVDAVPFADLGVRRALGNLLGEGRVLSPSEAETMLAPFAPYRGLAVFYLLVGERTLGRP